PRSRDSKTRRRASSSPGFSFIHAPEGAPPFHATLSRRRTGFSEFYAGADAVHRLIAVQLKDDPFVAPIDRRLVAQDVCAANIQPQGIGYVISDAEVETPGRPDI